jgi:hypothetical protein
MPCGAEHFLNITEHDGVEIVSTVIKRYDRKYNAGHKRPHIGSIPGSPASALGCRSWERTA